MGIADGVQTNMSKRTEKDFFQTPEVCIEALIRMNAFSNQSILDPCSGIGAIGNVFRRRGIEILENDLYMQEGGMDFLKEDFDKVDTIVCNPPYSKKNEFIDKALRVAKEIWMILPMQVVNYNTFHRNYLDNPFYHGRILMTPKFFMTDEYQVGLDKKGGVSSYAWFLWSSTGRGRDYTFEKYFNLEKDFG